MEEEEKQSRAQGNRYPTNVMLQGFVIILSTTYTRFPSFSSPLPPALSPPQRDSPRRHERVQGAGHTRPPPHTHTRFPPSPPPALSPPQRDSPRRHERVQGAGLRLGLHLFEVAGQPPACEVGGWAPGMGMCVRVQEHIERKDSVWLRVRACVCMCVLGVGTEPVCEVLKHKTTKTQTHKTQNTHAPTHALAHLSRSRRISVGLIWLLARAAAAAAASAAAMLRVLWLRMDWPRRLGLSARLASPRSPDGPAT